MKIVFSKINARILYSNGIGRFDRRIYLEIDLYFMPAFLTCGISQIVGHEKWCFHVSNIKTWTY